MTTPLLHIVRGMKDNNQRANYIEYLFVEKKVSIFKQDSYGRNVIMLLALQNKSEII